MTFQLICLIIGNLLISVLLLKGLHPILSVLAGVSVMIWTNGLPYFETFTAGLTSWGGAMMPTIYLTLLGGSLGVIYTKTGAITSMAKVLLIPSQKVNSDAAKICLCIIGFVFFRVLLGLAGFVNEAIIVTMMCMCGVIFKTADVPRRHHRNARRLAGSHSHVLRPRVSFRHHVLPGGLCHRREDLRLRSSQAPAAA